MRQSLLLQWYNALPQRRSGERAREWNQRFRRALQNFRRQIQARYFESALENLLGWGDSEVRQAACLALGLTGTMGTNAALAQRLLDEDPIVCELAADALWSIWFRADAHENNLELQRLIALKLSQETADQVLSGFHALIKKAPRFAEAYNQRALVYFRLGDYAKAVADCDKAMRLNPFHFGAASGMAQSFMKQRKFRAALRTYRRACRLNPNLTGLKQVIESLEKKLGEEGKR